MEYNDVSVDQLKVSYNRLFIIFNPSFQYNLLLPSSGGDGKLHNSLVPSTRILNTISSKITHQELLNIQINWPTLIITYIIDKMH